MKKFGGLFALMLMLASLSQVGMAQTLLEIAQTSHEKYMSLRQQNTDKDAIFQALYDSYVKHMTVLDSTLQTSSDYLKAKAILREQIYPNLERGAIFYQQQAQARMMAWFAQASVDLPKHQAFADDNLSKSRNYHALLLISANDALSAEDKRRAIGYLQEYVDVCPENMREGGYQRLARAYELQGEYDNALKVTERALQSFPNSLALLQMSTNICLESKNYDRLLDFALRTLKLDKNPDNIRLLQLNVGKAYEYQMDFAKAIEYFTMMKKNEASNIVLDHLTTDYYNLAAFYYNQNVISPNKRDAQAAEQNYRQMLNEMAPLVDADPLSVRYNIMMANAYNCLGNQEELRNVNERLNALGQDMVRQNDLPNMVANIAPEDDSSKSFSGESLSDYVKQYVTVAIEKWQVKTEFESLSEWQSRVNQATLDEEIKTLAKEAEQLYLEQHMRGLRQTDFDLHPYDAENGSYLLASQFGDIVVNVPRTNREAELFKSEWEAILFRNVKYSVIDGHIAIEHVDLQTPSGKIYSYDNKDAGAYQSYEIAYSFGNKDLMAGYGEEQEKESEKKIVMVGQSDVDTNIPKTSIENRNTFAFIIGNEHYKRVEKVQFAISDANTMAKYCEQTLGIPKTQVRLYTDASYMDMRQIIAEIKEVADVNPGTLNLVFYYAGHGVPNEADRSAYLLPVDVSSQFISECISVDDLYETFNELGANSVTVFLDACFSGSSRGRNMLASARGVALRSAPPVTEGNVIAFSAASGDETAWPYNEKSHGLFTYFLLKKLQSSEGKVSLGELRDYISSNVSQVSVGVNKKRQTPTVMIPQMMGDEWREIPLIK